ncbi:MAG: hypothetical protein LBB66_06830 [Desulfovibrio sp.]|nr:hypothetical protein [Desulfovibrio sp.]
MCFGPQYAAGLPESRCRPSPYRAADKHRNTLPATSVCAWRYLPLHPE